MKEIELTRGLVALVDERDYERLNLFCWNALTPAKARTAYARRDVRKDENRDERCVLMHREILGLSPGDVEVDHINGNGLDNRRRNLRICGRAENCRNSRPHKGSASKFKGVTKDRKRWRARIRIGGRTRYLGGFRTERKAVAAYDDAATKNFGKFAKRNLS